MSLQAVPSPLQGPAADYGSFDAAHPVEIAYLTKKAVEAGVKQAAKAGEAMRSLAESSNEAVQASTQIVATIQQQVVGMEQIGVAMQNINQAGTETAVSMVQYEKAAKNLHEVGQKLKDLVERFTV